MRHVMTCRGAAHTSGLVITDLRKALPQAAARPSLAATLALGFRPFFLLAGLFAAVAVPLWLAVSLAGLALPTTLAPAAWHGHEMVFGFTVAVVAGFLLTAVRTWTGQPMPSGAPLGGLALLWLAGRVAMLLSGTIPPLVAAGVDLAFVPALGVAIGRPLVRTKNWRNALLLVPLAGLFGANLFFHFGPEGSASRALRVAIDAVVVIVVVIGGRVIPSFTENALRVVAVRRPWLDRAALGATAAVLVLDAIPDAGAAAGGAAILGGVLNGARLAGWRSPQTRRHPILWVLHLGYAWLALGLVLTGVAAFVPTWLPSAPLHALTVGGIGTMVLGMMSRVALGHTGRMLEVSRVTVLGYVLLGLSAAVRALGPLVLPSEYRAEILVSGALFAAAFSLFVVAYLPILTAPRVDGKPG